MNEFARKALASVKEAGLSGEIVDVRGAGTRILVCGGRDYGQVPDDTPPDELEAARAKADHQKARLAQILRAAVPRLGLWMLIHGAAKGADQLASEWAWENGVGAASYPANWEKHGRAAGPIRNQRMLDEGKPDIVIAFPGGRGTADLVSRAEKAGIRVIKVDWS